MRYDMNSVYGVLNTIAGMNSIYKICLVWLNHGMKPQ